MCRYLVIALCLLTAVSLAAEELAKLDFETAAADPALPQSYGDKPQVLVNAVEPGIGHTGAGHHLKLQYGPDTPDRLTYYHLNFAEPVPIMPQLQDASFWVRTNVAVDIKVAISPFGFIYHGPSVPAAPDWQQVTVKDLYPQLRQWCLRGQRNADDGFISGLIVALHTAPNAGADLVIDDATVTAADGTRQLLQAEARKRRFARVSVSVVTLPWSDAGRSLETVLDRLDEAGAAHSDLVCLPMEAVKTAGEPIPGPLSTAIAAKAKEYRMYVVGNLREQEGGKTYITSFLCNRDGEIIGKYRKSHRMPDETDFTLGDDLPVFDTDFGKIAMRIGSDRFFADLDHVYTAKGASLILWSQEREPVEDEHLQDFPSAGRAQDYNVFIACARYSNAGPGWITNMMPGYRGLPIGRSYIMNRDGMRIACTDRKGSVATALIPKQEFSPAGRGVNKLAGFKCLTDPAQLPEPRQWSKRRVRLTAIENGVGIDDLLQKMEQAGQLGSDLVCTYEMVWISGGSKEHVERATAQAKDNLRRIAEVAQKYRMYVLVGGVVDRLERNEAILYGRDGKEVGRYFKVIKTHDEQICGDQTPVFETDFGRLAVRICADNALVELDRAYGVKGADIMFDLTQDWGPDAINRNLRNRSRCMDAGFFRVECTHQSSEVQHRSGIIDPAGVPVAQTRYLGNSLVTAVVDLDNDRPRRYSREWQEHKPGGYLPEYQDTQMPKEYNDLRETVLRQRRPELYGALWPEDQKQK